MDGGEGWGGSGIGAARRAPAASATPAPACCTRAPGGKIGLIDYGQSKRLPDSYRAAFARLVLELGSGDKGDEQKIAAALGSLGIVTEREEPPLQVGGRRCR